MCILYRVPCCTIGNIKLQIPGKISIKSIWPKIAPSPIKVLLYIYSFFFNTSETIQNKEIEIKKFAELYFSRKITTSVLIELKRPQLKIKTQTQLKLAKYSHTTGVYLKVRLHTFSKDTHVRKIVIFFVKKLNLSAFRSKLEKPLPIDQKVAGFSPSKDINFFCGI